MPESFVRMLECCPFPALVRLSQIENMVDLPIVDKIAHGKSNISLVNVGKKSQIVLIGRLGSHQASSGRLTRRQLMSGALGGFGLLALGGQMSLLAGCGGSGSEEAIVPLLEYLGVVATGDFASGRLFASNSLTDRTPVASGSFRLFAPRKAHLLYLTGEDGRAYGAAITSGASRSRSPEEISVNAESTLLAVLTLSPGIAASESELFESRIAQLKALPSYPAARTALAAALKTGDLEAAMKLPAVQTALQQVMLDYMDSGKSRGITPDGPEHGVTVSVDNANANVPQIKMENRGWRHVRATMRRVNADGSTHSIQELYPAMEGATGISFGSIFTLSVGSPGVGTSTSADFRQYPKTEVAFQGLGFKSSANEPLPLGISSGAGAKAIACTLLLYAVLPIIDVVVGVGSAMGKMVKWVETFWDGFDSGYSFGALLSSDSPLALAANIIDFVVAVSAAVAGALGIGVLALKILAIAMAVLGAANLLVTAYYYFTLPSRHTITLTATGSGGVIIS